MGEKAAKFIAQAKEALTAQLRDLRQKFFAARLKPSHILIVTFSAIASGLPVIYMSISQRNLRLGILGLLALVMATLLLYILRFEFFALQGRYPKKGELNLTVIAAILAICANYIFSKLLLFLFDRLTNSDITVLVYEWAAPVITNVLLFPLFICAAMSAMKNIVYSREFWSVLYLSLRKAYVKIAVVVFAASGAEILFSLIGSALISGIAAVVTSSLLIIFSISFEVAADGKSKEQITPPDAKPAH